MPPRFRAQALAEISEQLDQDADPAMLQRAADFFMENNQQDKAVGLLIMSRRVGEALDMCANYDVIITEDYAERMTVPKGEMDSKDRNALLERMGDICHSQVSIRGTKPCTSPIVAVWRECTVGMWRQRMACGGIARRATYVVPVSCVAAADTSGACGAAIVTCRASTNSPRGSTPRLASLSRRCARS